MRSPPLLHHQFRHPCQLLVFSAGQAWRYDDLRNSSLPSQAPASFHSAVCRILRSLQNNNHPDGEPAPALNSTCWHRALEMQICSCSKKASMSFQALGLLW